MTCREATEFLFDYLEGNLAEAVIVEFEIHIKKCGWCADYIASYRKTVTLTRTLGSEQPAEIAVPEELVQAILAARKKA
jgi:predicted anti-sigma-YlaC factor YlaD